jgi:GPH family glycoside/pentoside/hexuronide:cation symporter
MTPTHYATAPKDRISWFHRLIYGAGAFVNNLLAAASGGMMIVLNLGFGMDPALVGLLGALPRITDAFTDPVVGYVSDHSRTKWGRRRPFIFWGAIASGLLFILLWQIPDGLSEAGVFWWFLIGSILFYLAYTVFATPWVALGFELTPDYNERTRLMGTANFTGQLAYVVSPWFLWIMTYEGFFPTQREGAAGLAVVVALVVMGVGVLPAIFLREPMRGVAAGESPSALGAGLVQNLKDFFQGFGTVLKSKPFRLLCAATFLVFNGFMLIASFQFYVIIYYVFGGDQAAGAEYAGYAGTVGAVATFAVVVFTTWLGTKIGKRKAFMWSTGVSVAGYALKWATYNPEIPWLVVLPAPLLAFGLGGLFTLVPAMLADVVDLDELDTHERREGMFGSIYWWVVKLGLAAALALGGVMLNMTGFDVALGGAQTERTLFLLRVFDVVVPMVFSALAIWAIARFPITEQTARLVREQLEARRGTGDAPAEMETEIG